MCKTIQTALLRCPVGFSEEIIAAFQRKKTQNDTKNDKHPKIFRFSKFYAFFLRGLKHFEKGWLSSSLF